MLSLAGPMPGFLDAVLRLERLVANGIGGRASATVSGVDNPPVHGVQVASLVPCAGPSLWRR